MIIAGLTGGIATGKSTVSGFFRSFGAVILDADRFAHEAVRKGRPAWRDIVTHFGRKILLSNGEIDRKRLGGIIFHQPDEKEALNQMVHPHVFEEMARRIRLIRDQRPGAVVIQDVPLLIESGMHARTACIILVYVPVEVQLRRLMERDAISEEDARARIASQMDIEEKRRMADYVIDNQGTREETRIQAQAVYEALKQKADPV